MERDLIGWEWSDLLPHIEDDLRTGAFEMNEHQAEKAQADFKEMIEFEKMCELEARKVAWDALQAVPSYVEQQAREFAGEKEV